MSEIVSRNPANGTILKRYSSATREEIRECFEKSREAQKNWELIPVKTRCKMLIDLKETLIDQASTICDILNKENGKSRGEALTTEVIPCVDLISYYAKYTPKILKNRKIPMRIMKHRKSYLNFWPLGVVAVISPWNYPLFLPFGEIVMAVVAGNSVIFKPSEITPWIGETIPKIFNDAGFPKNLVQVLQGDGSVGAAIIEEKPNKVFFTGSVETGKKIMTQAGKLLIPVNLELGGKDPMIVFPDANLDIASSAALWGGYANAGQVCASIERLIVHETIAEQFKNLLIDKIQKIRVGSHQKDGYDVGPITFDKQKTIYKEHLEDAQKKGAKVLIGGNFDASGNFFEPTLIEGNNIEETKVYQEETFGPVIAFTTFKTTSEAVEKANRSRYGLLASIFTQNKVLAERVSKQLHFGTVIINEVLYTAGVPETPWGGVKDTGIGRTHSEIGLMEFVNTRHIHEPALYGLQWKSPWWFPYSNHQTKVLEYFLEAYRKGFLKKIKAIPLLLWHFIQMIKKEPRF